MLTVISMLQTTGFIFVMFFLNLFCKFDQNDETHPGWRIAIEVENTTAKTVQKKYGLIFAGSGGGGGKRVETSILIFELHKPITRLQARQLIIEVMEIFLAEMQKRTDLEPYAKNYPFTIKNVEVCIHITNTDGRDLYDPALSVVSMRRGIVNYLSNDPDKKYRYKMDEKETYEEALQILREAGLHA